MRLRTVAAASLPRFDARGEGIPVRMNYVHASCAQRADYAGSANATQSGRPGEPKARPGKHEEAR